MKFIFDLVGTLTLCETLPEIARAFHMEDKINALTQTRDRAQARADIAQGEVEDGLARLREEFGVSSVEEAEQKIEQGRRKIEQAVEELLAKVEELENG